MPRCLLALTLACTVAAPALSAQPEFWKIQGAAEFLEGDMEGLSLDSEGRLRVAPGSRRLADPEAPYVWVLARDGTGAVYAGTGNDGKVFRIEDGRATLFFDAPELEVHALAVGAGGRLYVGTAPDGKVYLVEPDGRSRTLFDPEEKYIWALAADGKGALYVATGAQGRIYRVDGDGKAEPVLSSSETHVTALLADAAGNLYAGSSPGGVIYRVDREGKAFVLHDSDFREIKALALGKDGALYVAAVDGKAREDRPSPSAVFTLPTVSTGEVTVSETITVVAPGSTPTPTPPAARAMEPPRPGGPVKGAVLRIGASGEVDTLWTSADEMSFAMAAGTDGVLVGTGGHARIYRVQDDRTWAMLSAFPAEQVTALHSSPGGQTLVATSNPGRLYVLEPGLGPRGTFTSAVKDTETVSSWGRLRWEGRAAPGTSIELFTRSGNTGTPDSTWTDWSRPYTRPEGEPVASENARFLQVRAVLVARDGATPALDSIATAYLQRNLRPQVQSVTVHPPGEVFQKPLSLNPEGEILGLDPPPGDQRPGPAGRVAAQPAATTYSRKLFVKGLQTFSWKADDPNGDALVYDVLYRAVGDDRFRVLRRSLTEAVLAWDTTTVPNGRYVVRVVASDAPSNPESLSLRAEKDSSPFEVDNTPPSVTVQLDPGAGRRVRAVARDDSSLVRRAEYSVDGGRWREVHPLDGINDALEETYEIVLDDLTGPGPHVVVVRATDLLGNMATARVEVP